MINKKYLINMLLNYIYTEIEIIRSNYNNYTVEFNINDTIYYFDDKKIIKGKIVEIDDYTKTYGEGALVYYWVTPKRNLFIRLYDNFRYKYSVLFKKPFIPRTIFFTHSVLFGNDIFQSEEEAEKAKILYNLSFYLNELLDIDN